MERIYLPHRRAFVFYKAALLSMVLFVVSAALAIFLGLTLHLLFALAIFFLWFVATAFIFLERRIAYRKERYLFRDDRVIHERGSLWSNKKTELILANVTNIELARPWIEHRLFKTGYVSIQSAGGGGTEVALSSISDSEQRYDELIELLRANGFSLQRKKLVQQESPHPLAVFFDVFKSFFGMLVFLFYVGGGAVGAVAALSLVLAVPLIFIVLVILFSYFTVRFLDLKQRIYYVYDDTILFTEGFLTKRSALIPFENLADSELNQTFVDKLFGLYDVTVSAPGSLQALRFSNMRNGEQLEKNLDTLIREHSLRKPKRAHPFSEKVALNPQFEASYAMRRSRALIVPALLSLILFAGLIVAVAIGTVLYGLQGLIASLVFFFFALFFLGGFFIGYFVKSFVAAIATRYYLKSNSVEEQYNFLTTKHKEFTTDKLTGVLVQRSFIDRYFNTFSVTFWSIGTAESITFRHLRYKTQLHNQLLQKAGIRSEPVTAARTSTFTLGAFITANLPVMALAAGAVLVSVVAGTIVHPLLYLPALPVALLVIGAYVYKRAFYKRTRLTFHQRQVHYQEGILFRNYYYARFSNVKDVTTTRYPLTHTGTLELNIAGEHALRSGKSLRRVSNSISIAYIHSIETQDNHVDSVLLQRHIAARPIHVSKPSVANTLFTCGVLGLLLLLVLGIVLALSLAYKVMIAAAIVLIYLLGSSFAVARIRAMHYEIDKDRVIQHRGVLYKTTKSLFMRNIDHINQSQGPLGKLFSNGNVIINTTGSSLAELTVRDVPDYLDFYAILKKQY